ncbi:MAG: tetratricopeptide repeat protein [Deltaproteobacteria bacterium]|nr:tetratricopeptide repeat protein [Deltaproteobacteria bacterium]
MISVRTLAMTIIVVLVSGYSIASQYESQGNMYFSAENYTESASSYEKALAENPNNKTALLMAGWSYFKIERYEDAKAQFERLNKLNKDSMDALEGLGWTDFKLGNYKESLKIFETMRGKDKTHVGAIEGIAYNHFKLGNLPEAKKYLAAALFENPYSSDSNLIRGFVALQEKDFSTAITFFEEAKTHSSKKDADIYAGLGNGYMGKKDYNMADYYYNTALEIKPKNQLAIAGKGQLFVIKQAVMAEGARLLLDGNFKGAIEEYQKVLQLYPNWVEVYAAKGWTMYKKGDYKGAYTEFNKGLNIYKLSYDIYDGIGWSALKLGMKDEAEKSFKKALEIFPGYVSSQEGLRQIKTK